MIEKRQYGCNDGEVNVIAINCDTLRIELYSAEYTTNKKAHMDSADSQLQVYSIEFNYVYVTKASIVLCINSFQID